ncbi:MAG: fumarate reductase subunit A [Thermovirga sp.]
MLSKTATGTASSTAYSSGYFTLPDHELGVRDYVETTVNVGKNINRNNLLQTLGRGAHASLLELQSWGITIRFLGEGHATIKDSAPLPIVSGGGFISELKSLAWDLGARFEENVFATNILVKNNRVFGVEYCDWMKGTSGRIFCKAVVLAAGGAGQIFERTDNPSRITGDGYALGLESGLSLLDMEFIQFYPVGFDEPRFPCWMIRLPIVDIARLTDGKGNEFLKEQMQTWGIAGGNEISLYARDRTALLVQKKLDLGDEVLLHLEDIEEEKWSEWDLRKTMSCYPEGAKPWSYGPVHVSPLAHYFCGGILIDESTATSIEGVYACGEVTGGVDGASRVGGNALSSMACFALRAGRESVSISRGASPKPFIQAQAETRPRHEIFSRNDGINPLEIKKTIQTLTREYLGPMRNGKGLRRAIIELEAIRSAMPDLRIKSPLDLLMSFEIDSMLLSSLAAAYPALSRQESRGVHYRQDFPSVMSTFEKNQIVSLKDGKFTTNFL